MNVAVLGASNDRSKWGNKAVRAYSMMGHTVFPINPKEQYVEGIECYSKVTDVPYKLDRVLVYTPPEVTIKLVNQLKRCGAKDIYINPGADSPELLDALLKAGIKPVLACSVISIGIDPSKL